MVPKVIGANKSEKDLQKLSVQKAGRSNFSIGMGPSTDMKTSSKMAF